MKTRWKLMDQYLHMWLASKALRKGRWQCEAKRQPVLSAKESVRLLDFQELAFSRLPPIQE
jgi:hypothetical protein